MMPSGKMMVVWSVLILGPIGAEYAKWPASAVTPGSPSESAKLVRGWSNQTRTAQPTDLPSSRGFVPVGGRRDFYVDFTRYGIRPGDTKSLVTDGEWLESDRGTLGLVEGSCDERGPSEFTRALRGRHSKATLNVEGVEAARITRHQAPIEQGHVPGRQ